MMMSHEGYPKTVGDFYTKEKLDEILRELGKVFRKLNGTKIPAEIVLVEGAAVIASFGFRESTSDIDALIQASSSMKDAIHQMADQYGLSWDWMNQDFKKTSSYSDKIVQYSVPYRTFSNILHVRTLPAEYVAAMKLASLREYKYDKSDVIGIIRETGITRNAVEQAVSNLYGGFAELRRAQLAEKLLDEIYSSDDLELLYRKYREEEQESFALLKELDQDPDYALTRDNVNDVIAAVKRKMRSLT